MTAAPAYPQAERLDLVDHLHGRPVADPYRWLEDPDDPRTREWSAAQDALARAHLDALPGRDPLGGDPRRAHRGGLGGRAALAGRAPVRDPPRAGPGARRPVRPRPVPRTGTERVLIDPAALDPTGTTTLDAWTPDHEGRLLAYQLSSGGDEQSVLHVLDVATGEDVEPPIDRCRYSDVAWLPGGEEFLYVRMVAPDEAPPGEQAFHRRIWRHRVGTPTDADVLIDGPGLYEDHTYYGVDVSDDGRWLLVTANVGTARRDSVWIADLHGDGALVPVLTQADDVRCHPWVERDGRLYLLTTDGAPRFRLAVTDPATPGREHWRELVAEDPDSVLDGVAWLQPAGSDDPADGLLALARSRHAAAEVALHDRDGTPRGAVPLPGLGSLRGLTTADRGHPGAAGPAVDRVDRPGHPPAGAPVRPDERRRPSWRPPPPAPSTCRRCAPSSAPSPPPTAPPCACSSSHRPPADKAPARPCSTATAASASTPTPPTAPPRWPGSAPAASTRWCRCAAAARRARPGTAAGNRGNKQNVFDDFHAAAQALIDAGDTAPDRLAILGGSNGGLLVGAALTQRPELYRAVVCSAPLLDMVRYEQFSLGRTWNDEYGTADDPDELGWLLSYSPYHHVHDGVEYPAVLFTVFDSDTRVDPLHARKMCAALQHATAGDPATRPVLLRRETDVGHGARSVSRSIALGVDQLSFLAAHTGLTL